MDIVALVIGLFAVLELSNVVMLYAQPSSRLGNGVGVFNALEKSKSDPEVHAFVRYLINWVAGTKLIFILLLAVIIFTGSAETKLWGAGALVLSIGTYYWRLHPIISDMDNRGQITPKGYSRTLGFMIAGFMTVIVLSVILSFLL